MGSRQSRFPPPIKNLYRATEKAEKILTRLSRDKIVIGTDALVIFRRVISKMIDAGYVDGAVWYYAHSHGIARFTEPLQAIWRGFNLTKTLKLKTLDEARWEVAASEASNAYPPRKYVRQQRYDQCRAVFLQNKLRAQERMKENVKNLSDGYIKAQLHLPGADVPPELIALKRAQIEIRRSTKQLKSTIKEKLKCNNQTE